MKNTEPVENWMGVSGSGRSSLGFALGEHPGKGVDVHEKDFGEG